MTYDKNFQNEFFDRIKTIDENQKEVIEEF
jgi:hypothetical protein